MMLPEVTNVDLILTGQYALTGALAQIATPVGWRTAAYQIVTFDLWCAADWTLSYVSTGDGVLVPANSIRTIAINANWPKGMTLIPDIFVTGAGTLNILAHRVRQPYNDLAQA